MPLCRVSIRVRGVLAAVSGGETGARDLHDVPQGDASVSVYAVFTAVCGETESTGGTETSVSCGGCSMSLNRRNPKRDSVEPQIVEVLQRRGFHVDRVSAPGFPDLVVTKRKGDIWQTGRVWFVEVKRPKGRYTAKQVEWRAKWQGPEPYCLRSVEDALVFPDVRRDVATEARKPSAAARPSKSKRKNHGAVFPEQVTT